MQLRAYWVWGVVTVKGLASCALLTCIYGAPGFEHSSGHVHRSRNRGPLPSRVVPGVPLANVRVLLAHTNTQLVPFFVHSCTTSYYTNARRRRTTSPRTANTSTWSSTSCTTRVSYTYKARPCTAGRRSPARGRQGLYCPARSAKAAAPPQPTQPPKPPRLPYPPVPTARVRHREVRRRCALRHVYSSCKRSWLGAAR